MSEIAICNQALALVGAEPISSFSDNTKTARFCQTLFAPTRDALLRSHYWNFAIARIQLAQLVDVPLFEYSSAYALPNDCLRVIRLSDRDAQFKIEGRKLFCYLSEAYIQYVKKETDTSKWDNYFIEALSYLLASKLAYPLVQSTSLAGSLFAQYEQIVKKAMSFDGQEGSMDNLVSDTWLDSRLTGPLVDKYYD
jgi:hypothetical protein